MSFRLSQRSLSTLDGVHPSLVRVAKRAIELTEVDFTIVQGRRTLDEQMRIYGSGRNAAQCKAAGVPVHYARPGDIIRTKTMRSNHLPKSDGYGHAIDFAPFVNGKVYMPARPTAADIELYRKVANAFKKAAMELCTPVDWGGDWHSFKDYPHIELEG